jgi:predicted dehydrogenase
MHLAIIGCGLIGQKRANAISDKNQITICVDLVRERAEALARVLPAAEVSTDWQSVVQRDDINLAIISTTHDALAKISLAAVEAGKHVLVEKPAAICADELIPVIAMAKKKGPGESWI